MLCVAVKARDMREQLDHAPSLYMADVVAVLSFRKGFVDRGTRKHVITRRDRLNMTVSVC